MRFTKTLLKSGTYHSPDGTVDVTPDRLRHWQDQFRRMRDARQIIPIDWDHSADAAELQPLSLDEFERKRSAKNTVGHVVDFAVTPSGDSAEIVFDVLDDRAIQAAEKNLVQVSPVLFPKWRDGSGAEYQDCITHVDFVNHAVDHSQTPFTPAESPIVACAIRMGLSTNVYSLRGAADMADKTPKRMGSDDPADGFFTKGGKVIPITVGGEDYLDDDHKPAGPSKKFRSRSKSARNKRKGNKRMSLVRMASDDKPDDSDKPALDDKPTDDATPPDTPSIEEVETEGYDAIDDLLDLLEECCQLSLPEDTDDSNLLDRLRTALLTSMAHKRKSEEDEAKKAAADNVAGPGAKGDVVQDTGVALMSLQAQAVFKHSQEQHRKSITDRLAALFKSGRCTPKELADRKPAAAAVRLSLTKAGEPIPGDLEKWLADRETLPRGTFWDDQTRIRMGNETVVESPQNMRADLTPEEVQDIANWALGRQKAGK